MCAGVPFPIPPEAALASLKATRRTSEPTGKRLQFRCSRCGSSLFGNMNENCQHCGPSTGPAVVDWTFMGAHGQAWLPEPSPAPFESGGGGDFGGAGASGSWGSGSTTPGTGD